MTKQEAIQAMKDGHKVTHRYFIEGEHLSSNKEGSVYSMDDYGSICNRDEYWQHRQEPFWQIGWEIYNDN